MKLNTLRLADDTRAGFLHKVDAWKPKNTKSFSLENKKRYNYSVVTRRDNYFMFDVVYYSTKSEGKYQFTEKWSWKDFVLNKKRYRLEQKKS